MAGWSVSIYLFINLHVHVPLYFSLQAYADEPLDNILMHVEDGPVIELDRWMLSVWPNPEIDVSHCTTCSYMYIVHCTCIIISVSTHTGRHW